MVMMMVVVVDPKVVKMMTKKKKMVMMMVMVVDPKDVQKQVLQDCFPDKWEIRVIKKLETGLSLSLYPQNLTKEDMR
eukprot:7090181-Ditylum_brightwellii.AAC.1